VGEQLSSRRIRVKRRDDSMVVKKKTVFGRGSEGLTGKKKRQRKKQKGKEKYPKAASHMKSSNFWGLVHGHQRKGKERGDERWRRNAKKKGQSWPTEQNGEDCTRSGIDGGGS